ncbi:MAG: T9SS C-terminal target domain-containing protein, partial [Bacteroidetes bacterium]
TGLDGRVFRSDFVANTYRFVIGQWGHRSLDTLIQVQPGQSPIIIDLEPGYYDDFALDFGWEVSGDAARGAWERGTPIETSFLGINIAPGADLFDDIGTEAYVTGNAGGYGANGDVDDGTTMLESPVMDLSLYREPLLRLHWWLVNYDFNTNQPGDDQLRIELSNTLGSIPIATFSDGIANSWNLLDSLPIGPYFAPGTPVTIRVVVGDEGQQHIVEAAIDGFEVFEGDPAPDTTTTALAQLPASALSYYPQPTGDQLFIAYDLAESAEWELYDLQGRLMLRQALVAGAATVPVPMPRAAGAYLAILRSGDKVLDRRKLLRQ